MAKNPILMYGEMETNLWSGENGQGPSEHPLLNHVILNIVFEHMRPNELKACRGVCDKWNLLTVPFMRSNFMVKIYGNQLNKPNNEIEEARGIEEFVQLFRLNKHGIPFTNFRLGAFRTTESFGHEFLQLCGDSAQEITFNDEEHEVFLVEDLSEFLKSMPKIESFDVPNRITSTSGEIVNLFSDPPKLTSLKKLVILNRHPEERDRVCPTFFEELFSAVHNVSELFIGDPSQNVDRNNASTGIVQVLDVIKKLGKTSSIELLGLDCARIEDVECLRTMANSLKLKKFRFGPLFRDEEFTTAQSQSPTFFQDTLEELDMLETVFTSFHPFPTKMPLLKDIQMSVSEDFDWRCADFKKKFPVLKELTLNFPERGRVLDEFIFDSEPCPNVKALDVTLGFMNNMAFDRLLIVFPTLTELQVDVKEDGVEILMKIWSRMPQLENLYIYGQIPTTGSLDSVFIGIPSQTLQEIGDLVKDLDKMDVDLRKETILNLRAQHTQFPTIANLTNLRQMHLCVTREGEEIETGFLTDLTAYLGLHVMKHLKNLNVSDCEFTKACCEVLKADMGLKYWNITSPQKDPIIPDNLAPRHFL